LKRYEGGNRRHVKGPNISHLGRFQGISAIFRMESLSEQADMFFFQMCTKDAHSPLVKLFFTPYVIMLLFSKGEEEELNCSGSGQGKAWDRH